MAFSCGTQDEMGLIFLRIQKHCHLEAEVDERSESTEGEGSGAYVIDSHKILQPRNADDNWMAVGRGTQDDVVDRVSACVDWLLATDYWLLIDPEEA